MSLERAENSKEEQDSVGIGGGVIELLKGLDFKLPKQEDIIAATFS
ncbi:MAG: hypothetical protein K2W95_08525 [Candidatus Obscuribacterales bacterium]|nr:hypothetical protein [Candidatus Obscuribacterales bacterium]